MEEVRDTIKRTRRANLRLKFSKCTFGRREVEFLGIKVSHDRVRPNDQHLKSLDEYKEPSNASELLRVSGLPKFSAGTSASWQR